MSRAMISTLFFDEVDASSTIRVRATRQGDADGSLPDYQWPADASRHIFASGSVPVPALRATLLWWLDRDAPLVQLLLTSSVPGGVSFSCRKMSVEIPVPRSCIIACGVTHVSHGTLFAVAWLTSRLDAGLLRVQLQRSSDERSHLALVPDARVVLTTRLTRVAGAFESEAALDANDASGNGAWHSALSACIIAAAPDTNDTSDVQTGPPEEMEEDMQKEMGDGAAGSVLAVAVLTNGVSVWRAALRSDGTVAERPMREGAAAEGGATGIAAWLRAWPFDAASRANRHRRRYAAVCAVEGGGGSPMIALLHVNNNNNNSSSSGRSSSSGSGAAVVEFRDAALRPIAAMGPVALGPHSAEAFGAAGGGPFRRAAVLWAQRVGRVVHIVAGGSSALWARLSLQEEGGGGGGTVSAAVPLLPPAALGEQGGPAPIACAAYGETRLALLWPIAHEEDACVRPTLSVGALLHRTRPAAAALLQLAASTSLSSLSSATGARVERSEVYFCHAGPLHALAAVGRELVLVEKAGAYVRAHALSRAMGPFERFVECAFAAVEPTASVEPREMPLPVVHLVPATAPANCADECEQEQEQEQEHDANSDAGELCEDRSRGRCVARVAAECFAEGLEVAASCADGVESLSALLTAALQAAPVGLALGGFQLLRSAAHLQGFTPSGRAGDDAMDAAVRAAAGVVRIGARRTSFCSFSRRFVQHTIARDLLSRAAFLVCSYIGWMASGSSYAASPVLPRLRVALEFLTAAHLAVAAAGPFAAAIAPEVRPTVVDDVLSLLLRFPDGSRTDKDKDKDESESEDENGPLRDKDDDDDDAAALFAVRVANQLRGCDAAHGARACSVWCAHLSRRYPLLQHFAALRDVSAGRSAHGRGARLLTACLAASCDVAARQPRVAERLLLDEGLAIPSQRQKQQQQQQQQQQNPLQQNPQQRGGAFAAVSADEWRAVLREGIGIANAIGGDGVAAKLYRVAMLRRVVQTDGVRHASASASASGPLVRELFLTDLVELEQCVRLAGPLHTRVCRALVELRLDTHLFLARAALDEPNFADAFRSLEEVLWCAGELSLNWAQALEQCHAIVGEAVEIAATAQCFTDALVATSHVSAALDDIVVARWYAFIARMPAAIAMTVPTTTATGTTTGTATATAAAEATAAAVDPVRMRAAVGLYRYLCRRHAFGQAGRVMADLATTARCSAASLRPSSAALVAELSALALSAVELIAPAPPLLLQGREGGDAAPLGSPTTGIATAMAKTVPVGPKAPLTRGHLPWLRRRLFTASCERALIAAGRRVDCTDLWVEAPPRAAHDAAARRFLRALMECRLWPEARRLAALALDGEADVGDVLCEQAADLAARADYAVDAEARDEWRELVEACGEASDAANAFEGLRRAAAAALSISYVRTHPALIAALERRDRYTAMRTLLEVFETLLHRVARAQNADAEEEKEEVVEDNEEEEEEEEAKEAEKGQTVETALTHAWLPLVDALRIGVGVLEDAQRGKSRTAATITAGLFDPLARRARELLDSPRLGELLGDADGQGCAMAFLDALANVKVMMVCHSDNHR